MVGTESGIIRVTSTFAHSSCVSYLFTDFSGGRATLFAEDPGRARTCCRGEEGIEAVLARRGGKTKEISVTEYLKKWLDGSEERVPNPKESTRKYFMEQGRSERLRRTISRARSQPAET